MERLKELIIQLKEQFDRKAEPAQMLETTRLLEAELQHLASEPPPSRVMPTKITVMMPSATKMYAGQQKDQQASEARKDVAAQRNGAHPEQKKEPAVANVQPIAAPPVAATTPAAAAPGAPIPAIPTPIDIDGPDSRYMPPPAPVPVTAPSAETGKVPVAVGTLEKLQERGQWPFNPLADKPTDRFTLSQRSREVNDVIGLTGASLNDKLKSEVGDLKSALNDTPVRDLKKAIGVNDRYVFINQLFRGDEVMYERSIKTINGFRILPEAEYWMERELKVKLGWDENRETTRHFYQLVKRRFS
jgi:hypothetical protein